MQNENEETALLLAIIHGHKEIASLLIDAGAQVDLQDSTGKNALHYAALGGQSNIIHLLLEASAQVDIKDRFERTALHHAAFHSDIIYILLEASAQVDIKDRFGQTALHLAVLAGHTVGISLLIDAGSDLFCQDEDGKTSFDLADESVLPLFRPKVQTFVESCLQAKWSTTIGPVGELIAEFLCG